MKHRRFAGGKSAPLLALALLVCAPLALAGVGGGTNTTTFTTSTTHHVTNQTLVSDVTVDERQNTGVVRKVVNGGDVLHLEWTLDHALNDPKVQEALRAALNVLNKEKPAFPQGASLHLLGTSSTFAPGSSVLSQQLNHTAVNSSTTVSSTTAFGPATILIGDNQSQNFFVQAGTENINTNTDTFTNTTFFVDQKTVLTGGTGTVETFVLQRTFLLELNAVYSNLFSGIPVALAQREGLVAAHNFIGDVNGRVFRAWLGPNEGGPPQGDGTVGDATRIFLSGSAGWLNQNPGNSVAGLHDARESANAGVEWKLNSQWNVGMAASYVHSDTNFSDDLGKQHIDGGALSAYVTWHKDPWYVDLLYSAALFDDTTNRNTLYAGNANGNANDWSHLVSLNFGYDLKLNDALVTGPYASLTYVHGNLEGYNESGGGTAALNYGAQSYDSLVSNVGWQANWKLQRGWGAITPLVHLGWERENLRDAGAVSATLLQSPFTLVGVGSFGGFGVQTTRERAIYDALAVGVGVNVEMGERWTFTFDAEERTDFGPRNDFSIALRAEYRF